MTIASRIEPSAPALIVNPAAVQIVLRMVCDATGLGFATVARLTDARWTACAVLDRIDYGLQANASCDVSTTMCRTMVDLGHPVVIGDAPRDPRFHDHPAPALFGFSSYAGAPIRRQDGSLFGALCALDPAPKLLNAAELRPTLERLAELVATQLATPGCLNALQESEQRLGFALKAGQLGNWELYLATGKMTVSDLFAQSFGLRDHRAITDVATLRRAIHPGDVLRQQAEVQRAIATGDDLDTEGRTVWPDGSVHWIRLVGNCIVGGNGKVSRMVGLSLDVTERRAGQATMQALAYHDALTGLANRRPIEARLSAALANGGTSRGGRASAALLTIDLDLFKTVNDTFGHAVGDRLLQAVAARLSGCIMPKMLAARTGGDAFAVLVTEPVSRLKVEQLARDILEALSRPHTVDGTEVMVGGSIGIALAPDDAQDSVRLWRHAEAALYRAKASGRGGYRFFDATMDTRRQISEEMRLALPFALQREEMRLHYQPIVDLRTGMVRCFEALSRWQHPQFGLLQPQDFIGLAEETGQIVRLGAWVLKMACREATRWPEHVCVSVNLSAVQFSGGDLAADVAAALAGSGLDPSRLELEVTETVLLQNSEANRSILKALAAQGVRIVLDDFGTGYSTLEYLRRFKFDMMKVDKSLLRDLPDYGTGDIIIRGVIGLGADLGIPITFEGVETPDQLAFLRRTGCLQAQGFLFSKPVPADEVLPLTETTLPRREERAPSLPWSRRARPPR